MEPSAWSGSSQTPVKVFAAKGALAPALLGWLFAILLMSIGFDPTGGLIFIGNDDAMRLVQVRDLIDGQGWSGFIAKDSRHLTGKRTFKSGMKAKLNVVVLDVKDDLLLVRLPIDAIEIGNYITIRKQWLV